MYLTKENEHETENTINQQIVLCGMFAALVATGAFIKISIPVQPFPMHFYPAVLFVLLAALYWAGELGGCQRRLAYLINWAEWGFPSLRQRRGGPAYLYCARPSAFCWGLQAPLYDGNTF